MMLVIIPISLFFGIIAYKLKDNVEKWKIGVPVNHTKEMSYYIPALIPAGVLFCVFTQSWWSLAVTPFMMFFWYWTMFDGFYNLLRRWYCKALGRIYSHITWWYTGTNDHDDAKTDNILQGLELWQHISIKIGGIIIFTGLYIFIYIKQP